MVAALIGIPGYYIRNVNIFSPSPQQIGDVLSAINIYNLSKDIDIPSNKTHDDDGTNGTKVIMFWTTWYGSKMWFNLPKSALGRSLFQRKYCNIRIVF